MNLTAKQIELIDLLKQTLPTAPPEIAQKNVRWYKRWVYNESVKIGDRRWNTVDSEDILYEVYNEPGDNLFPPEQVPAVWKRVYIEEYPEWVQPTGAHDAYAKDSKVTHNDKKWISDVDANVWEPGVYGWTEITE